MFDISNFWIFVLSVFLLSITPGPDMAYVVGQSVANGRRAGVISAAGVALGSLIHAIASVAGLTTLIASSPAMFSIIKYIGAGYLVYLGISLISGTLSRKEKVGNDSITQPKINSWLLLSKGFITTLTNPKVLLFFISFFPQFVTPNGQYQTESFMLLGVAYTLVAFTTDAIFALVAGSASGAFSQNRKIQNVLDRVVGTTFIGLGIRLALTRQ